MYSDVKRVPLSIYQRSLKTTIPIKLLINQQKDQIKIFFFSLEIFQENMFMVLNSICVMWTCTPTESHVITWIKRVHTRNCPSASGLLCDSKLLQDSLSFGSHDSIVHPWGWSRRWHQALTSHAMHPSSLQPFRWGMTKWPQAPEDHGQTWPSAMPVWVAVSGCHNLTPSEWPSRADLF